VIVVAGEALVDLVPKPGGLLYQGYAGGSPANTAVTIARLGTPVALLARLAGDHAGRGAARTSDQQRRRSPVRRGSGRVHQPGGRRRCAGWFRRLRVLRRRDRRLAVAARWPAGPAAGGRRRAASRVTGTGAGPGRGPAGDLRPARSGSAG